MSFDATIVLKNASAANVTMKRLNGDLTKVNYMDQSLALSTPRTMQIAHTIASSPNGADRHMVKYQRTVLDANSKPQVLTMTKTLTVPRVGIVRADIDDLLAMDKEFWTVANTDSMLRNEL